MSTLTDLIKYGAFPRFKLDSLEDVGAATSRPFVILNMGQSNSIGSDPGGSKTVLANIFTVNNQSSPTALKVAAFGSSPFNLTTGGGTTTDPALAYNNMGVQFANALRASGLIPASRPIIVVSNSFGAQSIAQWMGSGTSSTIWQYLVASLAVVEAAYPGFKIDHVLWAQGENDNTGTYGSQAAYTSAFQTLLAQLRGLSQWRTATTVSVQELALFADNTQQLRNDAIRTFGNGTLDPYVTMVSSAGMTESAVNAGPHFDGASLVALGYRHFEAWRQARISGGYTSARETYYGSAHAFPNYFAVAGGTLTLSPDDLRTGAVIDASSSATIVLPNCGYLRACEIYLNASGAITLQAPSGGYLTENASSLATSSVLNTAAVYRIFIAGNVWHLETVAVRVGGWQWFQPNATANATFALNSANVRGTFERLNGNTVTMPAVVSGGMVAFYGDPSGTASTLSGVTMKAPSGATISSYTVNPGQVVVFVGINSSWVAICDSGNEGRATQYSAPTTGSTITSTPGIGRLTHIVDPAATIAALTIALPSNPQDGQSVTYVFTQAVTTVTFSGGTVVNGPTSPALGQRTTLAWNAAQSKWY